MDEFSKQEIHGILCGGASSRTNLSSDRTKPLVIFIVYIENDYTTQLNYGDCNNKPK